MFAQGSILLTLVNYNDSAGVDQERRHRAHPWSGGWQYLHVCLRSTAGDQLHTCDPGALQST